MFKVIKFLEGKSLQFWVLFDRMWQLRIMDDFRHDDRLRASTSSPQKRTKLRRYVHSALTNVFR